MRIKSVNLRKVFVRTPSGKSKITYRERKPNLVRCSDNGEKLKGIPRVDAFKLKKTVKSKKSVNRKFGGQLSSSASRRRIIELARQWSKSGD
jgi:ribosomal protein L34E